MKKIGILCVLAFMPLMITGCMGGMSSGVKDNHFYSTNPKIALRMAKSFEYVNKKKSDDMAENDRKTLRHNYNNETHLFVDYLGRRSCGIEIHRLASGRVFWKPDPANGISNVIETGHEIKEGTRYQYVVFPTKTDQNDCQLTKLYARVSGGSSDTVLYIMYAEVINDKDRAFSDVCNQKNRKREDFTVAEQKVYTGFLNRCNEDMKFVDLNTLNLEKK